MGINVGLLLLFVFPALALSDTKDLPKWFVSRSDQASCGYSSCHQTLPGSNRLNE